MQLPAHTSWIRPAVIALAAAAIVAVTLFIAVSDALTPRANAQSECQLKVTMMEESEAAYILHLVDEDDMRLVLQRRLAW